MFFFLFSPACACHGLCMCEHLALALSHLESLRHAGDTNTNAFQAAGSDCLGSLCLYLPFPILAFTAPTQRQFLEPHPLYTHTSGGSNVFAFKCTFSGAGRCGSHLF